MDLLVVPVPLFNNEMAVDAYYFRYQRGNDLMFGGQAAGQLDGAMISPLLETLRMVGTEAFAMDKPIFVPISSMMLMGDLASQCPLPYEKIILLLDGVPPADETIARIKAMRALGFRFGLYHVYDPVKYAPVLEQCDYMFISQKSSAAGLRLNTLPPNLWHLKLVATHIDTTRDFEKLAPEKISLFEGRFYRLPVTKGRTEVSPLKVNLVRLLNIVQDESFEFNDIVEIIQRDTALTISLMKMINTGLSQKIRTISQAVTMLGQREVRKWATTAVSRSLGSDKPDEITRLSLIRAKFAENLAPLFVMDAHRESLFLTGLFSVLDVMLDKPMAEAISMVRVSDEIRDALVEQKGEYSPVLSLMFSYELADWKTVSRQLIISDLTVDAIYTAYISATIWYRNLITEELPE